MLYLEYSTDRPKLSHSRFLEAAGDGLVNFNPDDWPSMTGPIPRAGDLPLEQRADRERAVNPPPARRRHQDPADSSEDEEMVDEPDVPRSPLLMPSHSVFDGSLFIAVPCLPHVRLGFMVLVTLTHHSSITVISL